MAPTLKTVVTAVEFGVVRRGRKLLAVSGETGGWAQLTPASLVLLEAMDGSTLAEIQANFGLQAERLISIADSLHRFGLVTFDGRGYEGRAKAVVDRALSLVVLKLTNKCNMACKYCYNEGLDSAVGAIDDEIAYKTVELALEGSGSEGVNIVLHGGEPLLFFQRMSQIVEYAEAYAETLGKPVYFSLQTNGSMFNAERIEFVRDHNIGLGVSFDGLDDVNDAARIWRSGVGTSRAVHRGIAQLKKAGVPVNIITVVTRENDSRLDEVAMYLQDLGCASLKFSFYFPQGRADLFRGLAPDPEHVVGSMQRLVKSISEGSLAHLEVEDVISHMDSVITGQNQSMCRGAPCGAGKEMMTVFPSGEVYACDCLVHPEFNIGNVSQSTLEQSGRNLKLTVLNQRSPETLEPCSTCHLRTICGGTMTCRAFWSNGDVKTVDSKECFINQSMIEFLMWELLDSPKLLEYYLKCKGRPLTKPIQYA